MPPNRLAACGQDTGLERQTLIGESVQNSLLPDLKLVPSEASGDAGDTETAGHVERVCAYARLLASQLATTRRYRLLIDAPFIGRLSRAAALHDVGKAAIPNAVLMKPAALNELESTLMRQHTILGAEALEESLCDHPDAVFRDLAIEIACTHHERWDGTGYPYNLQGEQIPLGGRIVALADVYDALTSKRAYKEAFPHATARSVILEGRATHFDPAVVDAFLAREREFIATAAEHADRLRRAA